MSEQQTVPCPTCKGAAGKNVSTTRQVTDGDGRTVTVHGGRWQPCGPCTGSGRVVGGQG